MTATALSSSNIPLAETLVGQLHGLLESEFEQLKGGRTDDLDELQTASSCCWSNWLR